MARKGLVGLAVALGALFLMSTIAMAGAKLMVDVGDVKKGRLQVKISASGLKAGQEVGIRTMMGGVLSDVSFLAKPAVEKADDKGMVSTTWGIRGRTIKRLLKPGEHEVMLVDGDGNTLAKAKLMIPKPAKKK
jgi:hypothetical protein